MYKPKDTQEDRRYQRLHDQHGRLWGCVIELKTGDPSGPIDLLEPRKAPIMPPPAHMKVDSQRDYGVLTIDYQGWRAERERAWDQYNQRLTLVAQDMYADDVVASKIEDPPPALIARVGLPPERIEPVLAAEAGDEWVLGLTTERPDWADLFFPPERQPTPTSRTSELAFLDFKKQDKQEGKEGPTSEFPAYVKGAGRGAALWTLSDGSEFKGTKDEARAAETALTGAHPSWD